MPTEEMRPAPAKPLIDKARQAEIAVASGKPAEELENGTDKPKVKDAPRNQDTLQEGLKESMDASDPPAAVQP